MRVGVVASLARAAPRLDLEDPGLARTRKQMSRSAWLAAWATHQLLEGRDIPREELAAFFVVGPANGSLDDVLRILAASTEDGRLDVARFARKGVAACNPLLAFQLMNNFTLCHAAIREGIQGPNGAFFAAPEHALAEAARALSEVPWAIVVAADSTVDPVRRHERGGDAGGEAVVGLLLGRDADTCISVDISAFKADTYDTLIHDVSPYGVAAAPLAWLERLEPRRPSLPVRGAGRRVVITGVGACSAFGEGIRTLWDGLAAGANPAHPAAHLPGFPAVAAISRLPEVDLPREWCRDRRVPLTVAAALEAWHMAGNPDGLALSLGLGLEHAWLEDLLPLVTDAGLDWSRARQGLWFRSPFDLPARGMARLIPFSGPRLVHASACAGGTLAVAQAATWVAAGEAERVLCGGGDSMLNPLGVAGLQKLGVTSAKGECRPFDLRRDGIVVGEGAGCFVVESEESAQARGAPILAVVEGWASTQDGWAATAPRPDGAPAERAMRRALAMAGRVQVDHVAAHGTGTPLNDEAEMAAIARILRDVEVGSFKGALGHTMAAAGALELAGLLSAFVTGILPGTAGHELPDPQ